DLRRWRGRRHGRRRRRRVAIDPCSRRELPAITTSLPLPCTPLLAGALALPVAGDPHVVPVAPLVVAGDPYVARARIDGLRPRRRRRLPRHIAIAPVADLRWWLGLISAITRRRRLREGGAHHREADRRDHE